jgi:hypothetical protein
MATRRLPVIQEPTGEDAEAAARPAWQWVLIGSGLLVTIWTPSVALVLMAAKKIAALRAGAATGPGASAVLVAVTFALSAVAAGYLVRRFGQRTLRRHAIFSGLAAAGEIWFLALLGGAFSSALLAVSALLSLSLLSAGFCALGSLLARRKKP